MNSGGMVTLSAFSSASLVASKPSSCGMFVYNAETSIETRMAFDGRDPSAFTSSI